MSIEMSLGCKNVKLIRVSKVFYVRKPFGSSSAHY
jgi:hypothetical protein